VQVPANGKLDSTLLFFKQAFDKGDVGLLHRALLKGLGNFGVGVIVLGHKNDSRSILVQAVHNPWAQSVATRGKDLSTPEESVDEGATRVSLRRRERSSPPLCLRR